MARYEFQCRRKFLKEMSVDSYEDLKERVADIWRYCTHDWLRVCEQGARRNQSRWKSRDYWAVVQKSLGLFGQTYGVLRIESKRVRYGHLLRQIRGCCVSALAVLGSGMGTARGMYRLRRDLEIMLKSEGFLLDVARRQGSMANMLQAGSDLVDEAVRMGARIASDDLCYE